MAPHTRRSPEIPAHASPPPTPERGSRWDSASNTQRELGLWVRAAGYTARTRPGNLNGRRLGNYAGVYISQGEGWFQSPPTGRLEVRPGTFWWLFPEVPHDYAPHETWAEQWVIFDGPLAETFERQGFLVPERPLLALGDDAQVPELFARLKRVFIQESGPLSVPLASSIVHQLIVVVHGLATGLLGAGANADPVVGEVLKIIEREATRGLQPDDLAGRVHMGYSTLRRRFKLQTGYAVKEYILSVQLKKAKELLAFTHVSVEQVAAAAGFSDPYYFSRLFREREGQPPTAFRVHHRKWHDAGERTTARKEETRPS